MPLDAICLAALTEELRGRIIGMKIDKVQQPERDLLLFSLRGSGETLRLLVSANVGNARLQLTKESFEQPPQPPMFCMLLRKHLVGARIVALTQPERERLLILELDSRDELGDTARKQLVVEMIGRSANDRSTSCRATPCEVPLQQQIRTPSSSPKRPRATSIVLKPSLRAWVSPRSN